MTDDKRKLVILGVLIVVLGASSLLLVLLREGGGEGGGQAMTVEQDTLPDGGVEILVTLSKDVNVPETANGARTVSFECLDAQGEVVVRSRQTWPLLSDGNPPAPHVHQPVSPPELGRVAKCRFPDTKPRLEARLGLSR